MSNYQCQSVRTSIGLALVVSVAAALAALVLVDGADKQPSAGFARNRRRRLTESDAKGKRQADGRQPRGAKLSHLAPATQVTGTTITMTALRLTH